MDCRVLFSETHWANIIVNSVIEVGFVTLRKYFPSADKTDLILAIAITSCASLSDHASSVIFSTHLITVVVTFAGLVNSKPSRSIEKKLSAALYALLPVLPQYACLHFLVSGIVQLVYVSRSPPVRHSDGVDQDTFPFPTRNVL